MVPAPPSYDHLGRCRRAGVWERIRNGRPSSVPTSAPSSPPRKSKLSALDLTRCDASSTDEHGADAGLAEAAAVVEELKRIADLPAGKAY